MATDYRNNSSEIIQAGNQINLKFTIVRYYDEVHKIIQTFDSILVSSAESRMPLISSTAKPTFIER